MTSATIKRLEESKLSHKIAAALALWLFSGFLIFWTLVIPPFQNADESAHYIKTCANVIVEVHPIRGGFGHSYNWSMNELAELAKSGEILRRTDTYSWRDFVSKPIYESEHWRFYPNAVPNTIVPYALPHITCKLLQKTSLPYQYIFYAIRLSFVLSFVAIIWLARKTNQHLFVACAPLLMIPMVINQGSAISADYLSIGAAMLFGITAASMIEDKNFSRWKLAIAIFILWNSKIVYLPFFAIILVPLLKWKNFRSFSYLAPSIGAASIAGSLQYYYQTSKSYFEGSIEAQQLQMSRLLDRPLEVFDLLIHTISNDWLGLLQQGIGNAGWLTTPISPPAMWTAAITLIVWVFFGLLNLRFSNKWSLSLLVFGILAVIASFIGIFMSMFLFWTPPSSNSIQGVQGRYLLPLLFLITPLILANRPSHSINPWGLAAYLILACTSISFLLLDIIPFFY
ncbi:DUF2142 domain-containing protein [Hydrogenophaga sp. PAMC20947]|uniref:DUF2142 domain-containing protein n=1 Tax=Hydrogenophaga sp. PAMC20947 TaxID=2565558 RepID=UPI00109DE89A|nr:DUF2142 domain-containing protein [Hydrogenophaga sp. PAMC20947]QCB45755.1 DUF2142 domain-containing protein [Hydrogenophaga sp. PAMC20947]